MTAPDPVVALFAKWGAIQDEATALSAGNPEAKSGEFNDRWEAALDRRDGVGDKIMSTPATSIKGVAVKVRLASHYAFDIVELAPLHDTPSRDIDYGGEHGAGGVLNDYLVSALRDAERLGGCAMTSTEDQIAHLMEEGYRHAAVLAEVNKLTDAYRLKVLIEATEKLKKKMAERGSAVPLCTGGDPDHDDAS